MWSVGGWLRYVVLETGKRRVHDGSVTGSRLVGSGPMADWSGAGSWLAAGL